MKTDFLGISEYTDCLKDYTFARYFAPYNRLKEESPQHHPEVELYSFIINSNYPDEIESFIIGNWIERMITWKSDQVELDSIVNDYKIRHGNSSSYRAIEELYLKSRILAPGNLAPDFSGLTPYGDRVALSDLHGKVVYVDIWATWCGPCVAEVPFSKVLFKEFQDEEVAFLNVSIDDHQQTWIKWLEKDPEYSGIHIIQEDGWQGKILDTYLLKGIPQYLLIDSDGRIVTTQAPRPSSGQVSAMIHKLL